MTGTTLHELTLRLRAFVDARDWQKFQSPKNLVMALSVESAELMEHFQWLTEQQSLALTAAQREQVALEMADVFLYLLRLADRLEVDLVSAAVHKIGLNEKKYPPEQVRGSSTKRRD